MTVQRIFLVGAGVLFGLPAIALAIVVVWIGLLDRASGTITVHGEKREYLLHVPARYDAARPTPLVISLHAGATWPAHQMNLSHWNRLADDEGFLVVYPSGTDQIFGLVRVWRTTPEQVMDDVEFVSKLIDTLSASYNVDATRIYANGMSNGGGMTFALSCRLSARLAAVGMVAAAQQLPMTWCDDPRPMPLIAFHGDADTIVPYHGGPLGDPFNPVKPVYPAVRDWTTAWAARNGCGDEQVETTIATDVHRVEYRDCPDGAPVVLYTLLGGGHSWPGGKPMPEWRVGTTNATIDATDAMWTFFRQHRLSVSIQETPLE